MFRALRLAISVIAVLLVATTAVNAARPIIDLHTLDAYFALYAPDSNVPWKDTNVRLDTYSSAEVDFAAFAVDPRDVITAGSNTRPRTVNTSKLKPVATWKFTPPGGYQFQTNSIAVPLGSREGFFVIEARRGNVAQQVWINRTRIGLVSKQTPAELAIYGADLGTGRALAKMRIQLLSNGRFVNRFTDAHGIVRWNSGAGPRPIFALAQWGGSYAFVSPLPQAPLPSTIIAVRTDSAVVHAGDAVRVAGFARSRHGSTLRPSTGSAQLALRDGPTLIAQMNAPLDAAGAFSATFTVPTTARPGDYAVLASIDGGVGGATVHVDGNAGGLALAIASRCNGTCTADADVPLEIHATRGGTNAAGVAVHVVVVRSPHIGGSEIDAWGVTAWLDSTAITGSDGRAQIVVPRPTDGLASTYGITVDANGATAETRVLVPTARVSLRIVADRARITDGTLAGFTVTGEDATGRPSGNEDVSVELRRGGSSQQQNLTLDASGVAHGSFTSPPLGTSLLIAMTTVDGATASDATQIEVAAVGDDAQSDSGSASVRIATDRNVYRTNDMLRLLASDAGSVGDALLTLESGLETTMTVAPANGGSASAQFRLGDTLGAVLVGGAFVRDGSLEWNVQPVALDAPGRAVGSTLRLAVDPLHTGGTATATLSSSGPGTLIVRLSKGAPSGGAAFEGAPALIDVDVASTQSSAPSDATWHPSVNAAGDQSQSPGFSRRAEPPAAATLVGADSRALYWKVEHSNSESFTFPVPAGAGDYVLSVLRIDDDGRVTAAASKVVVK